MGSDKTITTGSFDKNSPFLSIPFLLSPTLGKRVIDKGRQHQKWNAFKIHKFVMHVEGNDIIMIKYSIENILWLVVSLQRRFQCFFVLFFFA